MFNFLWKQPKILHGIMHINFPVLHGKKNKSQPIIQTQVLHSFALIFLPIVFLMTPLTCHYHFRGSQDLSKHFGRISTLSNVSALPSTLGALRTSEALQQLQRAVATAERGKQQQALEVAWNDDFGPLIFLDSWINEPKNQKDSPDFFRIVYGESR